MRYRYVFHRAWQEISRRRGLWWYGLLASLVTPFCFDPSSQLLAPAYPWLDRFVAGHADQGVGALLDQGDQQLDLGGIPAFGNTDDHIVFLNGAQIPMDRIRGVH